MGCFFWQLEAKSLLTGYVWFDWQASKKKVYMLYNLEPDRSVTGGAWYSDQDFESEFVEVLNQQCFKYLEQRVSPSEDWYSAKHKLSEKEWTISDEKMLSCIIMYCTCKGYTIYKYIVKCNKCIIINFLLLFFWDCTWQNFYSSKMLNLILSINIPLW